MGKILVIKGADFSEVAVGKVNPWTKVRITVLATPQEGGTTTGSGSYDVGSQVTISATAASGYTFIQWNDGDTNPTRTITISDTAMTYTATFKSDTVLWYNELPTDGLNQQGWNTNGFPSAVGMKASVLNASGKPVNRVRIAFADKNSNTLCSWAKDNLYIAKLSELDSLVANMVSTHGVSEIFEITEDDIANGYKDVELKNTYTFSADDIIALAVNSDAPTIISGGELSTMKGLLMTYAFDGPSFRFKSGQTCESVAYSCTMRVGIQ